MGCSDHIISLAYRTRSLIGVEKESPLTSEHDKHILMLLEAKRITAYSYSTVFPVLGKKLVYEVCGRNGAAVKFMNRKFMFINDECPDVSSRVHQSPYRTVWTLFHEFAHFELGHLSGEISVRKREMTYDDMEKEANLFAATVLFPAESIAAYIEANDLKYAQCYDSPDIGAMARYFGVSWTAMIIRLDSLGLQPLDISNGLLATYKERKAKAISRKCPISQITFDLLNSYDPIC